MHSMIGFYLCGFPFIAGIVFPSFSSISVAWCYLYICLCISARTLPLFFPSRPWRRRRCARVRRPGQRLLHRALLGLGELREDDVELNLVGVLGCVLCGSGSRRTGRGVAHTHTRLHTERQTGTRTLRLPFSLGFFCSGMPSPRMTLTVPGATCGSAMLPSCVVVGTHTVGR